jgi:class III poly(R)-hydroxyalkanoic acid synthase PhaE subunit
MPSDETPLGETNGSDSLYAWWLGLIPAMFGASGTPAPHAESMQSDAGGASRAAPPAAAHVTQALEMTRQLMTPLYQAFLQALLANPRPEHAFSTLLEQTLARLRSASQSLADIGRSIPPQQGAMPLAWNFLSDPMTAFGEAMKPLSLNLERAYGGLADAFGLAPSRELQQAGREMLVCAFEKRQAQAEYLGLAVGAMAKGAEGMMARLREMGQRGESVDSMLALVRLWARSTDEAMHNVMQTPEALQSSARLLRVAMRSRQQQQRMVAIASEALNVPTRAEVDTAYREIQELKRELRRLKKAHAAPVHEPAAAPRSARARTPAAKRKNSAKVAA